MYMTIYKFVHQKEKKWDWANRSLGPVISFLKTA